MDDYEQLIAMAQARRTGDLYSPDTAAMYPSALGEPGASRADVADPLRAREARTDDGSLTLTEEILTALSMAGQSATFGVLGDEVMAGADVLAGNGGYQERRDFHNRQQERMRSEHPFLSDLIEIGSGMAVPAGAAAQGVTAAARAGRGAVSGLGGGLLAGWMEGDEPGRGSRGDEAWATGLLSGAAGGILPAAVAASSPMVRRANQYLTDRAFARNAPDIPTIRANADAAYARGDQGRTLDANETTLLAADIENGLRGQTAVLPTGDLLSGFGRLRDVVDTMDAYAGREMTPRELRNVSDTLQAAVNSENGREAAVATIIRDSIFRPTMYGAAPDYQEADRLWRTLKQSELIEQTMELADNQAGRHTGNYELALRSQFGNLERRIIRGTVEATPDEAALIQRIAQGGRAENLARDIGRWAPTGPVALATGGGAGAAIGQALGGLLGPGPGAAAGLLGGALVSGAGAVGRTVAGRLQQGNADALSALVRSGGQAPPQAQGIPQGILEYMQELAARVGREAGRDGTRRPLELTITRP